MPLTDIKIRNVKPKEKPFKLSDGNGMVLLVTPKGGKWWRLQYRFNGKQKMLSLGVYPDVKLTEARDKRTEARKLLDAGIDPSTHRKVIKLTRSENTFEAISREWIEKQTSSWTKSNKEKVTRRLEKDVFPWLGDRHVEQILAPDLLGVLERIEGRGTADTAHRVLQSCGQIFRYAVASGRARHNPCPDLRGALTPVKKRHFPAITDPRQVGELMLAIKGYQGSHVVRYALRLAPLLFVRPGELRHAEWESIDLRNALWTIPAQRMKVKTNGDHLVPLSRQAISVLKELHPLTGSGKLLFPGVVWGKRPISDNTINSALRTLGYPRDKMTGHGFRAMARTLLDEMLGFRPDIIEHQLAHAVRDPNGRAYNRTAHLKSRETMMQKWADYLDTLERSAIVTASKQRRRLGGKPKPFSLGDGLQARPSSSAQTGRSASASESVSAARDTVNFLA